MKKTISLLLALILLLSLIPMGACAAEDWAWRLITRDTTEYHYEDGTYVIYDNSKGWVLESTHPDYKVTVTESIIYSSHRAPELSHRHPFSWVCCLLTSIWV